LNPEAFRIRKAPSASKPVHRWRHPIAKSFLSAEMSRDSERAWFEPPMLMTSVALSLLRSPAISTESRAPMGSRPSSAKFSYRPVPSAMILSMPRSGSALSSCSSCDVAKPILRRHSSSS